MENPLYAYVRAICGYYYVTYGEIPVGFYIAYAIWLRDSSALFFSDDARMRAADQMPLMLNARRAVKPGTHWQQC